MKIRKAVGAIVYRGSKFLLIHKVKIAAQEADGAWDFPKGGVEAGDRDEVAALARELLEETGSSNYRVVREVPEKLWFKFDPAVKLLTGYEAQETIMYLVEYTGDFSDLVPNDQEIAAVAFFSAEEALLLLQHQETRVYFERFIEGHPVG